MAISRLSVILRRCPSRNPIPALLVAPLPKKVIRPKLSGTAAQYHSRSWKSALQGQLQFQPGAPQCITRGVHPNHLPKMLDKLYWVTTTEIANSQKAIFFFFLMCDMVNRVVLPGQELEEEKRNPHQLTLFDYLHPQLWILRICIPTSTQLIPVVFWF